MLNGSRENREKRVIVKNVVVVVVVMTTTITTFVAFFTAITLSRPSRLSRLSRPSRFSRFSRPPRTSFYTKIPYFCDKSKTILLQNRISGILLHPTSLPGKYGIGTLGAEARHFLDWMVACGQSVWQILPLGPTNESHSPYQSFSTFAGNPDLIDLDELVAAGLLHASDIYSGKRFPKEYINFKHLYHFREPLLLLAFSRFKEFNGLEQTEYREFHDRNGWWLDCWSLFYSCRKNLPGKDWSEWDEKLRDRDPDTLISISDKFKADIQFQQFLQFCFFKQWFALKKYANDKGILIFGDLPLYLSFDSVDVWSNQDLFLLDENKKPVFVGGVPPDYFSDTGQCWGTPVFNWESLKERNYDWWMARLHFNKQLFDLIRIDHFRGLESFWAIPFGAENAVTGEWRKAYGEEMLSLFQQQIGTLPIVAEDLGLITKEVENLRKKFNLPGMKVLQFAFTGDATNTHLPHNYDQDFVAYTGTHDNNTTTGWLNICNKKEYKTIKQYTMQQKPDHWTMISMVLSSVANVAIIPMQDLAGLDQRSRMNTPATIINNWLWRLSSSLLKKEIGKKLLYLTKLFGRYKLEE